MKRSLISMLCFSALYLLIGSCSSTDEIQDYISEQVNPFGKRPIHFAIYSKLTESERQLYFSIQLPIHDLTFFNRNGVFESKIKIQINVRDNSEIAQWDSTIHITHQFNTYAETKAFQFTRRHIRLNVPPGSFWIDVLILDENSTHQQRIRSQYKLEELDSTIQVSNIRFSDKVFSDDIFILKQIPHSPTRNTFTQFEIKLPSDSGPSSISLLLTKIKTDTLATRSIYSLNPVMSSLEMRGYREDLKEETFHALDTVIQDSNNQLLKFSVPLPSNLEKYGYQVQVKISNSKGNFISPPELFFLFPETFPELKTLKDAVNVIRYLATDNEYQEILSGGDSLLKRNFDRFWLKLTNGNEGIAKEKIAIFYKRVLESNLMFSTYKPGWKTDQGMIYIIFGVPESATWQPTYMDWNYYYRRVGGTIALRFKPIRTNAKIIGYYLDRQINYEDFWMEYKNLWGK